MTTTPSPRPPFVLLGNGAVALGFLRQLVERDAGPRLVVLNVADKQRDAGAIRSVADSRGIRVLEWSAGARAEVLELAAAVDELWLVSVYFGHLLDKGLLDRVQRRAINLHASFLPWCRGVHTNVWPIVERCPAGVTLHVMSDRVDSGSLLAQREVQVEGWDTAATLYAKLESAALELLVSQWPEGVLGAWPGVPQPAAGSTHRLSDFAALDAFDLDSSPEARRFFDVLRARSFPSNRGLTVIVDGQRVEATVQLRKAADE